MQTTIQIEDGLLAQATKLAQEKGCDLSRLIEDTLRDKIAPPPPAAPQPFIRLTTVSGVAGLGAPWSFRFVNGWQREVRSQTNLRDESVLTVGGSESWGCE